MGKCDGGGLNKERDREKEKEEGSTRKRREDGGERQRQGKRRSWRKRGTKVKREVFGVT